LLENDKMTMGAAQNPMPSLLVLDGESRTTLGIVRSLGPLGIPIAVGGGKPYAKAAYSRYADHRFIYPSIETDLLNAHRAIIEQVRAWRPDVLMPVKNPGWSCVYAFYDEYAELTSIIPCPGRELAESLSDKSSLAQRAKDCGVPTPDTFCPSSRDEALTLRDRLAYPVLLKPRVGGGGSGIRRAENAAEFEASLDAFPDLPVIQEHIDGNDLELTLLARHGEPVAGHLYASLRNEPLPYGPPIACRTIRDDDLMRTGVEFLKKLRFHGAAHMDFRRDKRDGRAKLLDFHARMASTNEMSIRCGLNFPLMLYRLALGQEISPCFPRQEGIEFRWLDGERRHLAQTRDKLQTVRELLRWQNVVTDFSLLDPIPHVVGVVSSLLRTS